jgi:hypothetical protein
VVAWLAYIVPVTWLFLRRTKAPQPLRVEAASA